MSYQYKYQRVQPVDTFTNFNKDKNRTKAEFFELYHDKQGYTYSISDLKKRLGFKEATINKLIKPYVPYVVMSNAYRNVEKGIFPFPEQTFFHTSELVAFLMDNSIFEQRTRLVDITRLCINREYKTNYTKLLKDLFIQHIKIKLIGDELTPYLQTSFFNTIAKIHPEFNPILLKFAWIVSGHRSRISLIVNGEGLDHRVQYHYVSVKPYNYLQTGELHRQKDVADYPASRARFGFKHGYINIRFGRTVFFGMPFEINSFFIDPLGDTEPVRIDLKDTNMIHRHKMANEMKEKIAEHIENSGTQLVIPAIYSDDDLLNPDITRVNPYTFENKLPNFMSFQQLINNLTISPNAKGEDEEL